MSTLVKFLLALVLNLVSDGPIPNHESAVKSETFEMKYTIQELNPHYIITREELLSQKHELAI